MIIVSLFIYAIPVDKEGYADNTHCSYMSKKTYVVGTH